MPFLLSGAITAALMVTISFLIEDALQSKSTLVSVVMFILFGLAGWTIGFMANRQRRLSGKVGRRQLSEA